MCAANNDIARFESQAFTERGGFCDLRCLILHHRCSVAIRSCLTAQMLSHSWWNHLVMLVAGAHSRCQAKGRQRPAARL